MTVTLGTTGVGGSGVTGQVLAAQFGEDYTGRVEATALADDAVDWRSLPKDREITR